MTPEPHARPGRPNKGAAHLDRVETDPVTKARARAILGTMTGELTVLDACDALGISKSRFEMLRAQMLEAAVRGLEPGKPGRPRKVDAQAEARVTALEGQLEELQLEVEVKDLALEMGGLVAEAAESAAEEQAAKPVKPKKKRQRKRRGNWRR